MRSWLLNAECIDQFSVIHEKGEKTGIMWNTAPELTIAEERKVSNLSYIINIKAVTN